MSDGIKDVLALAEAISARKATDERFADLMAEVSTALADISEALNREKEEPKEKPEDEAKEAELMGKAIAAALLAGIRNLPPPQVSVPEIRMPENKAWKRLEVGFKRGPSGSLDGLTLTRAD